MHSLFLCISHRNCQFPEAIRRMTNFTLVGKLLRIRKLEVAVSGRKSFQVHVGTYTSIMVSWLFSFPNYNRIDLPKERQRDILQYIIPESM